MTSHVGNDALVIERLCKSFGGVRATQDVSVRVARGEIHALIGPNGAGKTTLLSQLFGSLRPDSGRVLLNGDDITGLSPAARARRGMSRSFQITALVRSMSVLENTMLAVLAQDGHAFRFWQPVGRDQELKRRAMDVLAAVEFTDGLDLPVANLSHGEQRLLEFAFALAGRPSVVLLDEPMAGLGHDEGIDMTRRLAQERGRVTIILVEHDMEAVFKLADRITVLVRGEVLATGTPEEIRANPAVRDAYLGEDE